jgi:hypothetical protein
MLAALQNRTSVVVQQQHWLQVAQAWPTEHEALVLDADGSINAGELLHVTQPASQHHSNGQQGFCHYVAIPIAA